jgi:hypothetical protein
MYWIYFRYHGHNLGGYAAVLLNEPKIITKFCYWFEGVTTRSATHLQMGRQSSKKYQRLQNFGFRSDKMDDNGTTTTKAVRKSNNITGTPARGKMVEVTPNMKKVSEREQDKAKKSKQDKKNDLLN